MNKVNFKLLVALANESGEDHPIESVISMLAMSDIPMTDAVIRLGIAAGVLLPDYYNGWSDDEGAEF